MTFVPVPVFKLVKRLSVLGARHFLLFVSCHKNITMTFLNQLLYQIYSHVNGNIKPHSWASIYLIVRKCGRANKVQLPQAGIELRPKHISNESFQSQLLTTRPSVWYVFTVVQLKVLQKNRDRRSGLHKNCFEKMKRN